MNSRVNYIVFRYDFFLAYHLRQNANSIPHLTLHCPRCSSLRIILRDSSSKIDETIRFLRVYR